MKMNLQIDCECGNAIELPVQASSRVKADELDLSTSIEQQSEGKFFCSQNSPDGMSVYCTACGGEVFLWY